MRNPIRILGLLLGLALGLLAFGSCSHNETGPEDNTITRDSPENLLAMYGEAVEAESLSAYSEYLDDGYSFVFLTQDYNVAGVEPLAPYWGKSEDIEATSEMFGSSDVMVITCELTIVGDVERSDSLCTFASDVDLTMAIKGDGLDPDMYWVHQSLLRFTMRRDRYDRRLWVIREIREELEPDLIGLASLEPGSAAIPSTYGFVKAMFKKSHPITRDTPEHLLTIYGKALEEKSLPSYTECLDDDYRFFFVEEDWTAAGVDYTAPYWEKTEDVDCTSKMFASSHLDTITCELPVVQDISPSDTLRQLVAGADLKFTIDMGDVELSTFWVHGTLLRFTMCRDSNQPSLWVIREMREEWPDLKELAPGNAQSLVEPSTYGSIKAMWQ